jgi:ribulose-5-phosphate 4-epimerase/fuculose-1-phosphate aldolase
VADLGEHRAMILANHGLLVGGRTIPEAFQNIYYLERACQAQVAALAGGAELILPPESVRVHTAAQFNRPGEDALDHYEWAWGSALRLIENDRPDYRA